MDFIYVTPFNMTVFFYFLFFFIFSVFKISVNATECFSILELLSQVLKLA